MKTKEIIHKKCIICSNDYIVTYKQRKRKTCFDKKCFSEYLHNIKTLQNNEISNKKRKETNLKKYGSISALTTIQQSKIVKNWYKKTNEYLSSINKNKLYSKEQLYCILNTEKYNYSKYFGKSKNRTMINDDSILYLSLLHHTNFIEENKLYGMKKTPLSLRLLIAGKYNFILTDDLFCRCKSRLSFEHTKLDFSKIYCEKCILPRNSRDHFKYKYGDNWEDLYKLNCQKMSDQNYKNIMNYFDRLGIIRCPNIGKNEKKLLDEQEKLDGCCIDRTFTIDGYYPDGYCHTTNTIYEVYEPYHKNRVLQDNIRINNIISKLNCNVKIIYDGWNTNE